jgi:hypothetical protein
MKLHGKVLRGRGVKVLLWRRGDGGEHEVTVTALPLGFGVWLRQKGIVQPEVPVRVARDAQGKPMRDASGQAVVREDRSDASYVASVEQYQQRLAMLVLWQGLKDDPQVSWETVEPAVDGDWVAFADQLFEELEQAGVTMGEVVWLCEEITNFTNQVTLRVEETRADFFPAESCRSSGSG